MSVSNMGSGRFRNLTTGTRESVVIVVLDGAGHGVDVTRDRSEAALVTLVLLGPLVQAVMLILRRHVSVPGGLWCLVGTVVLDLIACVTAGCCTLLATCRLVDRLVLVSRLALLIGGEERGGTFVAVRQDTVASVSVVGLVLACNPD